MPDSSHKALPKVSIILPTYNRAGFLPQAFAAIRAQTWTDWELIVVDDGSTDETRGLVENLKADLAQQVRYIYQENQGPYGARNTGLDLAQGNYLAFYDSDDVWLPHHLSACVQALEANPRLDWVYGACRVVDHASGCELAASTFYEDGRPRPFLQLRAHQAGGLRIIDDPAAIRCNILHGFYCGLQNSLIRREIFSGYRFTAHTRNEAEDRLVVIQALVAEHQFGYLDNIHVTYYVHGENSSSAALNGSLEKKVRIQREVVRGLEDLGQRLKLGPTENRALRWRLSQEYFWILGYSLLWQNGRRQEALEMFRRGLNLWPWDWRLWKTYFLSKLRCLYRPTQSN